MIPSHLGRYEILEELGRGAMGRVYRARDPIVDREVAVKVLTIEEFPKGQRKEILLRFRRETQAAGQLTHPNIVTIFDVGESFFVMELVKGRTLQSFLSERRPFDPVEMLSVVAPIASALDYAHARGVVHRDVKPANIMMTDRGVPKLMDFGLAHVEATVLTRAGQSLGSPAYMAPEQIQGAEPTAMADLYSLATVSYEMLTGARPFQGKNITTLLHQVVHDEPVPPRHYNASLPPRFDELFSRALSKDPKVRFATAADFITELNLKELEAIVALIDAPEPPARGFSRKTEAARTLETVNVSVPTEATVPVGGARPSASATERRAKPKLSLQERRGVFALAAAAAPILLATSIGLLRWTAPVEAPLLVESSPSAATVFLDGSEAGRTPVSLRDLGPGDHEITVVMEGFVPARERLELDPDAPPAPLYFALQPARANFSLTSSPGPAKVRLDGVEVGVTPLSDVVLEPGSHRLEVSRGGFEPWTANVDARLGETLHFIARLRPRGKKPEPAPTAEPVPLKAIAELGDPGVTPPRRVSGDYARYPDAARRQRVSGSVTLSMVISETGTLEELEVVESGGPLLDEAVSRAVAQWRFEPATRNGQPVKIRWLVRQRFRLD
jgi:TonB family protein